MRAAAWAAACLAPVCAALQTPPPRPRPGQAQVVATEGPPAAYDFTYASPSERRYAAEAQMRSRAEKRGDLGVSGLRVVLLGKPASGKGTIAPMLCVAYRIAQVGLGNLLRSRARVGDVDGARFGDAMRRGQLLPDEVALGIVAERVSRRDAVACGWLLDGFPRTAAQAERMVSPPPLQTPADLPFAGPPPGDDAYLLVPDAVVVLDRPDALALDFTMGRCTDSATGTVYHPKFAPPPPEVEHRLVWRTDDREDVLRERLEAHDASIDAILSTFRASGDDCEVFRVDNARSELETFAEICAFLDAVEDRKLGSLAHKRRADLSRRRYAAPAKYAKHVEAFGQVRNDAAETAAMKPASGGSAMEEDVAALCLVDETPEACARRIFEAGEDRRGARGRLSDVVSRCNEYYSSRYAPVLVGDRRVGAVAADLLRKLEGLGPSSAVEVGPNPLPYTVRAADPGSDSNGDGGGDVASKAVFLAPFADSPEERTRVVGALVEALVADSELQAERSSGDAFDVVSQRPPVAFVPREKLRNELQDVRPVGAPIDAAPLLRIERAAVVAFGIPSYGCHVTGYVDDPQRPGVPASVWLAKRALSKPTYPGLLDQIAAGGLPAGLSLLDNARKEAEEEASIPAHVLATGLRAAGSVSYKYAAKRGLSTKTLVVFDLKMPPDLVPMNGDGEVDEFIKVSVPDAVLSLRNDLYKWKPNSALVMLDFAMRHGFIDPNDDEFLAVSHQLRSLGAGDAY